MLLPWHHRCRGIGPRCVLQRRGALQSGLQRFTATDLAISLQFRWDYVQDILCLAPTRSENSQIPSSCGESFATLWLFPRNHFQIHQQKGSPCCFVIFTPPKTNIALEKRGAWKTTGPFFGDMLVFGVYCMHYIHMALLILVDSPIPNIDLLAGLWPCSKDATWKRRCCCCCCTEKELRNANRIRFLKKKWTPQKTETTKI